MRTLSAITLLTAAQALRPLAPLRKLTSKLRKAPVVQAAPSGASLKPYLSQLIEGEDLDKDVQAEILIALGRISVHAEESAEVLREYLRAPSQDLAQSAILGLGLLGDEASWDTLHALLVDDIHDLVNNLDE